MSNPHPITQTATAIAAQLSETDPAPRGTIWRIVRTIGPERAQAFVAQALEIEANGGMLIPDGTRKHPCQSGATLVLLRIYVRSGERHAYHSLGNYRVR